MNNNNSNLKLTGKILATGIMSFCGVVSETAMNVTFPTLMSELVLSLGWHGKCLPFRPTERGRPIFAASRKQRIAGL